MIVVDASVAVKWFVAEADDEAALQILQSPEVLIAPDLIVLETLNVLRRKLKKGSVTVEQMAGAAATLVNCFDHLIPSAELADSALRLAMRLDHPLYDCAYLACAMKVDCVLISADRVFTEKVSRAGLGSFTQLLAPTSDNQIDAQVENTDFVERAILHHEAYDRTVRFVLQQTKASPDRFGFVSMQELGPAFASPTRLSLKRFVYSLTRSQRTELLALGWLGQGYSGRDWPSILSRAQDYLTEDPAVHIEYLMSVFGYLRQGRNDLVQLTKDGSPSR